MQTETILGQVVSKANNYMPVADTTFGRRIIKTQRLRDYEKSFAEQCTIYKGRSISRPFIFHATFYESTNSYDLDNGIKTVLDCLQYVQAITNDNLCTEMHVRKVVDPQHPRVEYAIQELEPTFF
jgi:Holliday junction resolvase RusA-like endonuclease